MRRRRSQRLRSRSCTVCALKEAQSDHDDQLLCGYPCVMNLALNWCRDGLIGVPVDGAWSHCHIVQAVD